MDQVLESVALLILNWRVGLSLVVSVVLAVLLASWLTWFTGVYGIALVLAAVAGGMVWQGSVERRLPSPGKTVNDA